MSTETNSLRDSGPNRRHGRLWKVAATVAGVALVGVVAYSGLNGEGTDPAGAAATEQQTGTTLPPALEIGSRIPDGQEVTHIEADGNRVVLEARDGGTVAISANSTENPIDPAFVGGPAETPADGPQQ